MSFLNLRKTKKESPAPAKKLVTSEMSAKKIVMAGVAASAAKGKGSFNPEVLRRPHITEKASASSERGAYVFKVSKTANKREIAQAVSHFYKVTPLKIRTVNIPPKRIIAKGRPGVRPGGKKAYVYLKKGTKLDTL